MQQRNAIWAYTGQPLQAINTPKSKTSTGTGRTGKPAPAGQSATLPGYVSEPNYTGASFGYNPRFRDDFVRPIPKSIQHGVDGLLALNPTYRAHDFVLAQYANDQNRRASAWQEQAFPPSFRDLVQWQQVRKYRVFSQTVSNRPLDPNNYFLGYVTQPQIAAQIGGSGLGYMGG